MAIAVKDIQLQEVELALMSLDNIKPNKEGKSWREEERLRWENAKPDFSHLKVKIVRTKRQNK